MLELSQARSSCQPLGPAGLSRRIPAKSKVETSCAQAGKRLAAAVPASAEARSWPSARAARTAQETGPSTRAKRLAGSKNQRLLSSDLSATRRSKPASTWISVATWSRSAWTGAPVTKWSTSRRARNWAACVPREETMERSTSSPFSSPGAATPMSGKAWPRKVTAPLPRRLGSDVGGVAAPRLSQRYSPLTGEPS